MVSSKKINQQVLSVPLYQKHHQPANISIPIFTIRRVYSFLLLCSYNIHDILNCSNTTQEPTKVSRFLIQFVDYQYFCSHYNILVSRSLKSFIFRILHIPLKLSTLNNLSAILKSLVFNSREIFMLVNFHKKQFLSFMDIQ